MEKTFIRRKPIKCPNCGFRPVAIYSYGEPAYSLETAEELEEGKIVFGGCCISEDSPLWHCTNCKTDFYKEKLK